MIQYMKNIDYFLKRNQEIQDRVERFVDNKVTEEGPEMALVHSKLLLRFAIESLPDKERESFMNWWFPTHSDKE